MKLSKPGITSKRKPIKKPKTNITEATPENQHRTTSCCNSQNETINCGHINSNQKAMRVLHFCLTHHISSYVTQSPTTTTNETYLDIRRAFENVWKYLSAKIFGFIPKHARHGYLSKWIFIEFGKLQEQGGKDRNRDVKEENKSLTKYMSSDLENTSKTRQRK